MGGWAVAIDGRDDPGGILLLVSTKEEADSLAAEIRLRGVVRVVARPQREFAVAVFSPVHLLAPP
jgi:hypothetical protein